MTSIEFIKKKQLSEKKLVIEFVRKRLQNNKKKLIGAFYILSIRKLLNDRRNMQSSIDNIITNRGSAAIIFKNQLDRK